MSPLAIAGTAFVCVFASALVGLAAKTRLPDHHLASESKDAVKLGMGLVATMAALVLGLLIASAKGSYDTQGSQVRQMAANVLLLNKALEFYGEDAKPVRDQLRRTIGLMADQLWEQQSSGSADFRDSRAESAASGIYRKLQELKPTDDFHKGLHEEATKAVSELVHARWQLVAEQGSSIPTPFLFVLVFWLCVLFGSFGLFAPFNATVLASLFVCALSVSGAVFLILELDRPFSGLMQLSSEPFRRVLDR
jgi:hypothetical protein